MTGFADDYAPGNWTEDSTRVGDLPVTTGEVVWSAPASVTITGQNDGGSDPDGVCPGGLCAGDTWIEIDVVSDGTVSFDWDYTTNDFWADPAFDPFIYVLDGAETQVVESLGAINQTGSESFAVTTGQTLKLLMRTADNKAGEAFVVITNFSAPSAAEEGGEEESSPTMYAINASTFGLSTYSGISPKAVAYHEGRTFMAMTDALYENTGDDDDGTAIAWEYRTGNLRLNSGIAFNIFQVTPLIRADNEAELSLLMKYRGNSTEIGPFRILVPPDRNEVREWPSQTGEGHAPTAYAVQLTGTGPAKVLGCEVYVNPHVRGR